ncbi:MAG: putative membrane protein [Phycisphaerales bacterium]|jgi:uncharacterized membrane protein
MTKITNKNAGLLTGLAALTIAAGLASAQQVVELDSLAGGVYSSAEDINEQGRVVGSSFNADGTIEATMWTHGEPAGLGIVGGADFSFAFAVNNRGEAVGYSETASSPDGPGSVKTATYWSEGMMVDVGAAMGLTLSIGNDINDYGVAALQGNQPRGTGGYSWSLPLGGVQAGPDPIYNFGANLGINNQNDMVGYGAAGFDGAQAIRTDFDANHWDVGVEIGIPAIRSSAAANAINNRGKIVGSAGDGKGHVFEAAVFTLDPKNPVEWLGKLPKFDESIALDVNDSGLIVGQCVKYTPTGAEERAVVWINGQIMDLNTIVHGNSGFRRLHSATGLNNKGDIVGYGETVNGEIRAYVLSGLVPSRGHGRAVYGTLDEGIDAWAMP